MKRYALMIEIDGETCRRGAGRKPLECGMDMAEAIRMEEQGIDKGRIARQMGVSLATYYRKRKNYLKEMAQKS